MSAGFRVDDEGVGQDVVAWDVRVMNQHDELVSDGILTLVMKRG